MQKIRVILTVFLVAVTAFPVADAARYRQPAYLTNFYFTSLPDAGGNMQKPGRIINIIRANDQDMRSKLVLELIADKGKHRFSIEMLDLHGDIFQQHQYPVAIADKHDFIISITLKFGGSLPTGGIFFKIYDRFDDRKKTVIGTFRLFSDNW